MLLKKYQNNSIVESSDDEDIVPFSFTITDDMKYCPETIFSLHIKQSRATTVRSLPVTAWNQGSTGLCWAAAVECIGDYMVGYDKYGAYGIAAEMGIGVNEGAYTGDAKDALSNLYGISTSQSTSLTDSTIISKINNNKPMYLNFQTTDAGHALTLCGYVSDNISNYFAIRVMDSNIGKFVMLNRSGGEFTYYGKDSKTYTLEDCLLP